MEWPIHGLTCDRTDRILLPIPGVGTEAGTAGTAIGTHLRLAFTTAATVDLAFVRFRTW
ncbi:hypothetical protein [Streptomyces sp. NPDC054765]